MLKVNNLKKSYGDFKLDCSISIEPGSVTGIIGANGAGKSTLFKAVLDLISIDQGEIVIFGKDYKKLEIKDKEEIGVVLAETGFSGYLTIKQIVPILSCMYHKFDKKQFIKECERFDLPMGKQIKEFSTGMKAKINVLIAISHEADLLILDEPTAGLDVMAREEILDMLRSYMEKENRSIIISSHISSDLEGFCDDIYMIKKGKIIFHEETDKLLDIYGLLKLSEEQYNKIERNHIFYSKKENYGYRCLTKNKQYFIDNYPQIVVEKGNIDEILMVMEKGER